MSDPFTDDPFVSSTVTLGATHGTVELGRVEAKDARDRLRSYETLTVTLFNADERTRQVFILRALTFQWYPLRVERIPATDGNSAELETAPRDAPQGQA